MKNLPVVPPGFASSDAAPAAPPPLGGPAPLPPLAPAVPPSPFPMPPAAKPAFHGPGPMARFGSKPLPRNPAIPARAAREHARGRHSG